MVKRNSPPPLQPYEGLKLQDLRRLKDMLIVETADMLQAPLFTAEALLRAHGVCVCLLKKVNYQLHKPSQHCQCVIALFRENDIGIPCLQTCECNLSLSFSHFLSDWDREKLLEAWMSDAEGCCQRSGVAMPIPPPSGYNAWDTLPSPRTPRTPRSPLTLTLTSPTDSCLTPGEEGLSTVRHPVMT